MPWVRHAFDGTTPAWMRHKPILKFGPLLKAYGPSLIPNPNPNPNRASAAPVHVLFTNDLKTIRNKVTIHEVVTF